MSAPFMSPSGNVRTFPWFLWESEVLTSLWWDAESSFSARGRRLLVKSWSADTCPSSWWIVSCRDGIQPAATAAAGWTICHDPTSVYLKIPSPIPWFVWSSFSWTHYASCSPVSLLLRRQRSASQGGFTPIVCVLGSESDDESMDSVRLSSSGICRVFQNGPAEIACPHGCGNCLGNIMEQSGSFESSSVQHFRNNVWLQVLQRRRAALRCQLQHSTFSLDSFCIALLSYFSTKSDSRCITWGAAAG